MGIAFTDRSFCFTGALADLKRSAAQREVRARGGLTQDRINERLDYLVVGSKGSPGWKHGSYGRKIEEARELSRKGRRPFILSETQFMAALAEVPPTNAGSIDAKVVVVTYKFITDDPPSFDEDALESALGAFHESGAHVTIKAFPLIAYNELFESSAAGSGMNLVVEARIVRQTVLTFDSGHWLEEIERSFEAIRGIDGSSHWFERVEGSADYVRLLRDVPEVCRIPGL